MISSTYDQANAILYLWSHLLGKSEGVQLIIVRVLQSSLGQLEQRVRHSHLQTADVTIKFWIAAGFCL